MEWLVVPALAVFLDLTVGDPPNIIHPVAWMGKVVYLLETIGLRLSPFRQFVYGLFMTLFIMALFTVPVYYLLQYLHGLNIMVYSIVAAILLKLMFTISGINKLALKIKSLLNADDLERSRFELRGLVSRQTAGLEKPLLASAAVESVAEGSCDSVVAPLFYFLILGVPGAIAYRTVNTLDSMIGYHGKYEYLGKFAARLDDVLNYIPARLAAFCLIVAAISKKTAGKSWQTASREHKKTESPNAGWPMSAMAGALGVRLEKTGHYVLGDGDSAPSTGSISRAVSVFTLAALLWVIICLATGGVRFALTT
jgi:adenosylcobinamide-phosphate synthase